MLTKVVPGNDPSQPIPGHVIASYHHITSKLSFLRCSPRSLRPSHSLPPLSCRGGVLLGRGPGDVPGAPPASPLLRLPRRRLLRPPRRTTPQPTGPLFSVPSCKWLIKPPFQKDKIRIHMRHVVFFSTKSDHTPITGKSLVPQKSLDGVSTLNAWVRLAGRGGGWYVIDNFQQIILKD